MKHARLALTRTGLASIFCLALLLPLLPGCSSPMDPLQPEASEFEQFGDPTSFDVAPEYCPNLPPHDVVVIHNEPGDETFIRIWFWGVGEGYDLTDGNWPGWSIENNVQPHVNDPGRVSAFCSYDDALPGNLSTLPIHELNYLLNHKIGDKNDVQAAIWLLVGGVSNSVAPTANSHQMVADAQAYGTDFVPGPGELMAILLETGDGGLDAGGMQDTMIELRVPGEPVPSPALADACMPQYWRTHYSAWPEGYAPDDEFDSVFGTNLFALRVRLGHTVWSLVGGKWALARHATAALLNAAHPDVAFSLTEAEVIALTRAGDVEALAEANRAFDCPLSGPREWPWR